MRRIQYTALVLLFIAVIAGCGKKEVIKPNAKFLGTYQVKDVWGSSKPELGSGSLEYELTIKAKGDSAVVINNINRTLMNVTAMVSGDSLIIDSQTAKSPAGKSYDVDVQYGYFDEGKLILNCDYNDLYRGDLIGAVAVTMTCTKDSVTSKPTSN